MLKRWFPYFYLYRILDRYYFLTVRIEIDGGRVWWASLRGWQNKELCMDLASTHRKAAWRLLKRIENENPIPEEYKIEDE